MERAGRDDEAESIHELVLNDSKRFRGTSKRFKLWPSRVDRDAFEVVMDNDQDVPAALDESRIVQAHRFFVDAMTEWAGDEVATAEARLGALAAVLQQHLQIVAIDLGMVEPAPIGTSVGMQINVGF